MLEMKHVKVSYGQVVALDSTIIVIEAEIWK